jgi:hypothetical protein
MPWVCAHGFFKCIIGKGYSFEKLSVFLSDVAGGCSCFRFATG